MSLKIKKETAQKLYVESPEWFKEQLVEEFGEACFKAKCFEDIKTIEDARIATEHSVGYLKITDGESTDEWAYRMLKMVAKAINQGWEPDWSNRDEYKYYPWFEVLSSGFGFSRSRYHFTFTDTYVGSRLCFESREKSNYAATQFIDLYKQFLL